MNKIIEFIIAIIFFYFFNIALEKSSNKNTSKIARVFLNIFILLVYLIAIISLFIYVFFVPNTHIIARIFFFIVDMLIVYGFFKKLKDIKNNF